MSPGLYVSIDFIRTYTDLAHHGKEEDILFRELSKKDLAKKKMHSADDLARQIVEFIYSGKKKMLYDNCSDKYCLE